MGKSSKKTLKWVIGTVLVLLTVCWLLILYSPYGKKEGFSPKLIKHSIEIDAPKDTVYKFLSNSGSAARWSVFVNHISTLNADSFADGAVGCRRRCYCNADEQGRQWDELITEVIPGSKRQLVIYNLKDFPMTATNLTTEQRYESISATKTRLTFIVFFKGNNPSFLESLKTYIGAYSIQDIFERNMANIKEIIEKEYHG